MFDKMSILQRRPRVSLIFVNCGLEVRQDAQGAVVPVHESDVEELVHALINHAVFSKLKPDSWLYRKYQKQFYDV